MWMTQPSDRYVGGRKISWVNKPKGLTVRCYRQAHPLGPHSFWKAVIIYYTGAHRAPFEWAWSPVWRRNDCYLAGQSNGVIIISHQEWSSKWKREGWHEGFLYCLFQTHTGLCQHISFWYAQIALSHTWPESPLGLSYVECISFSKLISKYSFLTAFFYKSSQIQGIFLKMFTNNKYLGQIQTETFFVLSELFSQFIHTGWIVAHYGVGFR